MIVCSAYVELQSFSVNYMAIDRSESASPVIEGVVPTNATWAATEDFVYTSNASNIVIDNEHHTITGINPGSAHVTATHKCSGKTARFFVRVNKNAIIIIPGIFGSELFCGADNPHFSKGTPLITEEVFDSLVSKYSEGALFDLLVNLHQVYHSLECNDNGVSKYRVYTKRYKPVLSTDDDPDEYTTQCGMLNTYRSLYNIFNNNRDVRARYDVEFFSYDWRLSNGYSASKLDTFISSEGYDKVVLVAHSMGGLVASSYLAIPEEERAAVQQVFYIASPLLGCAEIVNVWRNLDATALADENIASMINELDAGLSVSMATVDPIRKLMSNFPSVYELMPSAQYFTLAGKKYLKVFDEDTGKVEECLTYESTMALVSDILPYFNRLLMSQAEAFHRSLYLEDGLHISSLSDSYYLYGTGVETRTIYNCYKSKNDDPMTYGQEFTYRLSYVLPENDDNVFIKLDAVLGDGLVAQWSATLGGGSAYNDKIYCCPRNYHTGLVENNSKVRAFITGKILGNYAYVEEKNFKHGYGFVDLSWVSDNQ